jgi:hypothetical protein
VPFCYAIKKYSLFVTPSKMAILQSLTTFLLLFIYFFSCVYTGYYSDPVPAALEILRARPGGEGQP